MSWEPVGAWATGMEVGVKERVEPGQGCMTKGAARADASAAVAAAALLEVVPELLVPHRRLALRRHRGGGGVKRRARQG